VQDGHDVHNVLFERDNIAFLLTVRRVRRVRYVRRVCHRLSVYNLSRMTILCGLRGLRVERVMSLYKEIQERLTQVIFQNQATMGPFYYDLDFWLLEKNRPGVLAPLLGALGVLGCGCLFSAFLQRPDPVACE
jgi:hypothetical protein